MPVTATSAGSRFRSRQRAVVEPVALAPKQSRRLSVWWLLPLLLVGVVALVFVAWEPARSRVAGLLAGLRPAATEPASGGPGGASERAAPGETTIASPTETSTTEPTVAPTATRPPSATPRPTATPQPTATPPPTATLAPTATPPPRATPLPSPTPKAPLPAASGQSLAVSLQAVANASTADGYVDPPVGDVVLGGVRFSLGRGGSVTTQASPLPNNPKSISLPVDAQAPQAVYLLLTGGDLFSRFAGQTVGRVRLVFVDGKVHAVDLVAGQNLPRVEALRRRRQPSDQPGADRGLAWGQSFRCGRGRD